VKYKKGCATIKEPRNGGRKVTNESANQRLQGRAEAAKGITLQEKIRASGLIVGQRLGCISLEKKKKLARQEKFQCSHTLGAEARHIPLLRTSTPEKERLEAIKRRGTER